MKRVVLFFSSVAALLLPMAVQAQSASQPRIWRCGNAYTNNQAEAQAGRCKQIEGGNVTVVEGTKPAAGARGAGTPTPSGGQRVDSTEQRARDSDARAILEAELKKAEARQADLVKEYNNGEPEKMGPEHKNYQKYLDRVAELKASIARNESDIAGLRRELSRVGGNPAK